MMMNNTGLEVYRVREIPAEDRGETLDKDKLTVFVHETDGDGDATYTAEFERLSEDELQTAGFGTRGGSNDRAMHAARTLAADYLAYNDGVRIRHGPKANYPNTGTEQRYCILDGVTHSKAHVVERRDARTLCGIEHTSRAKPAEGGIEHIIETQSNLCSNCRAALESRRDSE